MRWGLVSVTLGIAGVSVGYALLGYRLFGGVGGGAAATTTALRHRSPS